ncbi:MAG: head-tail connector protein [Octadecabacter sp.]|nr:head-tail connector protein [Octadecabacter sp.]NNJ74545.1 hypothetical protein [Anderseniella sp.]
MNEGYSAPSGLGTVADLLKRCKATVVRKSHWGSHIAECYDYAIPQREVQFNTTKGQKKNTHIYDCTAITSVQEYANSVVSALCPAWRDWISFEPGIEHAEEVQEDIKIKEALEKAKDIFFSHIHHSNYATELHESCMDLAISTGCFIFDENHDSLTSLFRFRAMPLAQVFPEEGPMGSIETHWFKWDMEGRNITRHWPDAKLPEKVQKQIDDKPEAKLKITHGVVYSPDDEKYHTVIILEKEKCLIYTQSEDTNPVISFREFVVPGEVLGRGRVMSVLPQIKTANAVVEYTLRNAAMAMGGAYTAMDDGVINPYTAKIEPFGMIPVASNDRSNPSIRALERSGDFTVGELILEKLQEQIRKALFSEPFGDITETPGRTATEMTLRSQQLNMNRAASFGRLETELIEKVARRGMDILRKAGKVPDIKIDGRDVEIKHTSPLAQAQDQEDLMLLNTAMEMSAPLGPEIIAGSIKIEDVPGYIYDKLNVEPKLQRTEGEKAQLTEMVAQMLAAMQAQQEAPQDG